MSSIRWAFNISKWEPTEKEFLFASSCIQMDEKNRIGKFVYKKDAKASLIGRLMIRKFVSEYTGLAYNDVELIRDSNNKPIYKVNPSETSLVSFNISHQGSFTVLAGEIGEKRIGVDVMKLEYSGGKPVHEFFRIMKRNFSMSEWRKIKGISKAEQCQVASFCRNWALKESYVKAIGTGITTDLSEINFDVNSDLQENYVTIDTCLYVDNEKQDWMFEESLLDPLHCVAVALEKQHCTSQNCLRTFNFLSFEKLLENAVPLLPQDLEYCRRYFLKETK